MAKPQRNAVGTILPAERIEQRIFCLRGHKVMLSADLASLYGVPAKRLNEAVRRNKERFPEDFMFQLSAREYANLKSQIATSSWGGARRSRPYAFTEQGVAMLSSVLRSSRAVAVNIQIMRAFVHLRQLLQSKSQIRQKLDRIEKKLADHDEHFAAVFEAIRQLMEEPDEPSRPPIGYETEQLG